jgi:hypothetical protein
MLKILKRLTKGIWKGEKATSKVDKKKPRKQKLSDKSREELIENFLKSTWKEVHKNGGKSIKVSAFIKKIGAAKRSEKIIALANEAISENGLFIQPALTLETPWNELLRISDSPEKPLGEIFKDERSLESFIAKHELYKELGVESVDRQHSPKKTKDKLDFLGYSGDELIILELKNQGGGKSAVEQVLRYAGYKKEEFKNQPTPRIRKILVTGIANKETAMAIQGMRPEERLNFEWYLYKYDSTKGSLLFVRITEKEIESQLNVQNS